MFRKLALFLLLALPLAAAAQDYTPPVLWPGYLSQPALQQVLAPPKGTPKPTPGQPTAATLPFRRDPAITRRVEAGIVAGQGGSATPAGAALSQTFASQDVLVPWGEALTSFNLQLNTVADALTANWLVLYLAANEIAAPPTAAQVAGLRRQALRLCAAPSMAALLTTSTRRQEMADYLHLQAFLTNNTQSSAEQTHDAAASAALAQQARAAALQNLGFDPTTVVLTAKGLVKK
ncbi:MAG: hypothetical protein ACRYFX_30890 [Janthinobacterium lividum]